MYDLRPIDGTALRVSVEYIYRHGDDLYARTTAAEPFPSYRITGNDTGIGNTYVLLPRTKK